MRHGKRSWFAGAAAGAIVAAISSPALGQDINETVSGPSSGVVAAGVGTQNVTVTITTTGDVDNPAGAAVVATAQLGNVTVTDHGVVTGGAGGILGQTSGPQVSVTVTQGVAGGTGNAVEALDNTSGAASVTVGDGQNGPHPLTLSTSGKVGAGAISVTGEASIQVGGNVSISAGAPGEAGAVDVLALGVFTPADSGGPSAVATVGKNATLTVQGNGSAAVAAQIGQSGIAGPNGTASTAVTVGDGVAINVSGFNDVGVIGFVDDLTPLHRYAGTGDVSVSVGTGTINVSETGAVGVASGALTNVGEGAFSAGGDVSITNAADITVSGGEDASIGIDATTTGAGSATVTSSGSISSANGAAVNVATGSGLLTVNLTSGDLTASTIGVDATSTSGDLVVSMAKSVSVTAGGVGVDVTTGAGQAIVSVAGDVVASGVGINVTSTSGAIDVSTGESSTVVASGVGVQAQTAGSVFVDDEGSVAAGGDGVFAQSNGGAVFVAIGGDVTTAHGTDAVEGFANGPGSATVTVGSGTHGHPLTITGGQTGGVIGVSLRGTVNVGVGDNVTVSAGAPGVSRVADIGAIGVLTAADQGGLGVSVDIGRNADLTLAGNQAAAVTAQIGQLGLFGPAGGTASATASVGDGVAINVSGLDNAGVIAFVTDISPTPHYVGFGDASVSVGTGSINVNEAGAIGSPPGAATNIGEGAFSAGGNVSITNAADITLTGALDLTEGLETATGGAGASSIATHGDITVNNGDAILARTQNGASLIDIEGGAIAGTDAAVNASSSGGAITIDVAAGSQLSGGVRATSLSGAVSLDNAGQISGGVSLASGGPVSLRNEFGALINGAFAGADHVTFNNAGVWLTAGASDFGTLGGAASNTLNNTGLIQIGLGGGPTAAAFNDLGAFNNGSASATGVVSMVNQLVGDSLTVSGLFTGAAGHSLLGLDVQLGGPGSVADQLILQGGSAGQTLIRVNDVLHGHGALNPGGIVLVQGSSAASTFALDPTQPGYDPVTKGIDKGLFTFPLVFSGGDELLVGEPGLSARQLATIGAAAEDIWSSTDPGDQSEGRLAFSLANGGAGAASGPHLWAQAVNGGPSRLNGGRTLLGRASFAEDPTTGGGPPLAGIAQQTSTVSAYGMTYGFNTGYAQNVSALLTGVDLASHVGEHDAWSWGVSTGYLESQQSFTAGSSIAQYRGALAAIHGAYVGAGGFHVAGDVKMTALQVSYATAWGGGGASTPNATIDTFGAEADAGWTRPVAAGWTLEPVASLSMQSSRLGALAIQGVDVRFGDAASVRLGLGAKLDGGGRLLGLAWKSETSLKLWDELRGANTLDLSSAGAGSVLPDPIGGTFADAAQSFSLVSPDGRASAFVSGAYRWKADYQAAQLSMGVKLAW